MTTRRTFLGLAAAVTVFPYPAHPMRLVHPMRPTTHFYYDPFHKDEHSICRVYVDESIGYERGTRPAIFTLGGGGWHPTSGTIKNGWTPVPGSLLERLYLRGWAVIHMAYTVANTTTPNQGAFDSSAWISTGPRLLIDETKHDYRHQERDAVLAVQYLRKNGARMIDSLDVRPGSFYFDGRSAGGQAGCWLGFSGDRSDRLASNEQFRMSTLIAGIVQRQHIASAKALLPGFPQYHLRSSSGALPSNVGQVPPEEHGRCWHLRWAHDEPKVPCYLSGDGTINHTGPWDWASFQGVLTGAELHASDHVKATEQMPGHHPASVFLTGPVPPTWDADVEKWLLRVEAAR